jgi:aminoglycoside phosphotransferase (APT) family kinase protein
MEHEHRIIAALASTPVPVAPVAGLCTDPQVDELPFYVMDHVDGLVIRDADSASRLLGPEGCRRASESIVDTLAAIHAVDPVGAGLGDLGRHEGYIARQLRRWQQNIAAQRTRELPLLDRVHDALAAAIPPQGPVAIVHGDYRLDNCMLAPDGTVRAVLDWEICTLGDPLADVGLLLTYWTGPGDDGGAWANSACTAPGFMDRADLASLYAERSGRDLADLDFYVAFAHWKLACIIEGVYARYLGGALGDRDPAELAPFAAQVDAALERAARMLGLS